MVLTSCFVLAFGNVTFRGLNVVIIFREAYTLILGGVRYQHLHTLYIYPLFLPFTLTWVRNK